MLLYYTQGSYYSMLAYLALLEARVPFKEQRIDLLWRQEHLSAWYRAINPHMTVPSLQTESTLLTDSRDILQYARQRADGLWLDSEEPHKLAIERIVEAHYQVPMNPFVLAKALQYRLGRFLLPYYFKRTLKRLQKTLNRAPTPALVKKISAVEKDLAYCTEGMFDAKWRSVCDQVSQFLKILPEPQKYLLGDRISSADIVCITLFHRLKKMGGWYLLEAHPTLKAWFQRMQKESAYKKAF